MNDFRLNKNKSMEGAKEMVKSGEIWQMVKANGETQEAYIVKAFENTSVILTLSEDIRNPGEIQIQSRAQMWADPRRIRFTYNSNFADFVKKVPEDEAERINTMTRYTLFGAAPVREKSTDWKAGEESDDLKERAESPETELDSCHELIADLENENIKYQAQIEMMRGMYNELLDRAIRK